MKKRNYLTPSNSLKISFKKPCSMENALNWKILFEHNWHYTKDVIESKGTTPNLPIQLSKPWQNVNPNKLIILKPLFVNSHVN